MRRRAFGQDLPGAVHQRHRQGAKGGDREMDHDAGTVRRHRGLRHLVHPRRHRQIGRVDGEHVALIGVEARNQQQAVRAGAAHRAVFQRHRHIGDAAGRDDREAVVDMARDEQAVGHQHQRAAIAEIARRRPGAGADSGVRLARRGEIIELRRARRPVIVLARVHAPAQAARLRHRSLRAERFAVGAALMGVSGAEIIPRRGAEAERQEHGPVMPVLEILVDREIEREAAADRLAPV